MRMGVDIAKHKAQMNNQNRQQNMQAAQRTQPLKKEPK
jgi:hypothetical protein